MHNVMAAQSVGVGEESILMDPIEQAARATETTVSGIAGGADRAVDMALVASDQTMRVGIELVQTVQHTLHCGARLATRLNERSVDQFGRAIGITSGENAGEAAQTSARNFQAVMQSGAVLAEISRRLCEEWMDIARARLDRAFDRVDMFQQCRTPQDFAALQSEFMRDNMETFLDYAHKAAEHVARLGREARRQSANVTGDRRTA